MGHTRSKEKNGGANLPPPGYYELSEDVVNPHPDKRTVRDPNLGLTFSKGWRFFVDEIPREVEAHGDRPAFNYNEVRVKRIYRNGNYDHMEQWYDGDRGTARWNAIAAKLVPVEWDLALVLALEYAHNSCFEILEVLMNKGKISLDDVSTALDAVKDQP